MLSLRPCLAVSAAATLLVGCAEVPTASRDGVERDESRHSGAAAVRDDAALIPFQATFAATANAVAGGRCPVLTTEIAGTGVATHLGRASDVQSDCFAPPSLAFTDGRFTFVAANGDALEGTYSGELVPVAPPVFAINGHFNITGGTGRFTGARGTGIESGEVNLATGKGTVTFSGSISPVGSS